MQRASGAQINPQVTRTALNSTGYTLTVAVGDSTSDETISNLSCTESNNGSSVSLPGLYHSGQTGIPVFEAFTHTFPVGSTTVTCTGTDSDGVTGTNSVTVNVLPANYQPNEGGIGSVYFYGVDNLGSPMCGGYGMGSQSESGVQQVTRTALNSTGYTLTFGLGCDLSLIHI